MATRSAYRLTYVRYTARVAAILFALATSACFRYVETRRPLTAAECPEEASRGFFRARTASADSAFVSGRVTDATQESAPPTGLAMALVRVGGHDAVTDANGRFQLALPAGRYEVRTLRVGYRPRTDTLTVDAQLSLSLDIGLEQAMLDGCPGFISVVTRERRWRWWW